MLNFLERQCFDLQKIDPSESCQTKDLLDPADLHYDSEVKQTQCRLHFFVVVERLMLNTAFVKDIRKRVLDMC